MANNEDTKFFEQKIWEFKDSPITDNNLNVSISFNETQWGISPARLKFQIANYKRKTFETIFLNHRDVMLYLSKFGDTIELVNANKKEIMSGNTQKGFTCKCERHTIKTVFLSKSEYGGELCVRFAISEKDSGYLDSEIVYTPHIDYLSLITIFKNFKENYLTVSNNVFIGVMLDKMYEKIDSVNSKFNQHLAIISDMKIDSDKRDTSFETSTEIKKPIEIEDVKLDIGNKEDDNEVPEVQAVSELQDFNSFVKENKDTIKVEFVESAAKTAIESIKTETKIEVKLNDELFTSKILGGDLSKLEQIVVNSISTDIPLLSILKVFVKELGYAEEDIKNVFFPKIDDKDYTAIMYLSTRYLKVVLNTHLSKKQPLQDRVFPFFAEIDMSNKFVKSMAYDLFLYFAFYTQIKNQIQPRIENTTKNKSISTFCLKLLLSPIAMPVLKDVKNKELFISEIMNRYKKYKELGVFKNVIESVHGTFSKDIDVSDEAIKTNLSAVCNAALANLDNFSIRKCFSMIKISELNYDEITKDNFTIDQLRSVLIFENYKWNEKPIDYIVINKLKLDTNIPEELLTRFNVKTNIDTKNIINYLKETSLEESVIDKITTNIKEDYRSLKDLDITWNDLSEIQLKAIYVWDIIEDPKIMINYDYFKKKVDECTIEKQNLIAFLHNINERKDENYAASLSITSMN